MAEAAQAKPPCLHSCFKEGHREFGISPYLQYANAKMQQSNLSGGVISTAMQLLTACHRQNEQTN